MSTECRHCRHQNPERARFCGRCGRGLLAQAREILDSLPGPRPRPRRKRCCGPGSLLLLLCLGAIGVCWVGSRGPHRSIAWPGESKRNLSLNSAKAQALFNLLAPDDVAVMVGPHHHGRFNGGRVVSVSGSPEEVRIVRQFAELLARMEDERGFRDYELIGGSSAGTCERTYRLRRSRAKSLAKMLSFDDVPVVVTRLGSRLAVSATVEDHRTISGIVRILGGRQYD